MRRPEELRDVYADVARTIKEYQEVLEIHLSEQKPKPGDTYTEYLKNKISELKSNQILIQWILREDMDKQKTSVSEKLIPPKEPQTDYISIDDQISILKDTLDEMMTGFDSEENKMDFILDICNGYKKRIEKL